MKKNILVLISCLLVITATGQKGFDIGISGAFTNTYIWRQNNYGTLSPFALEVVRQSEMNYKPTWGGYGGIDLGYNFTKNWGIKASVQYCITGQQYFDNFTGPATIPEGTFGAGGTRVNVQRDVKLGYVQIPLMARYVTTKGKRAKFFVAVGPQFGIRTSAYEQVRIEGHVYLPDSLAFTPGQKFQSFDVGVALNFGVDVYIIKRLYLEIGLSGYCGIMDLNGNELRKLGWYDKNHITYQKSHNSSAGLQVGIHYVFRSKPKGAGRLEDTDAL
jgi:hypothetical protein